MADPSLRLPAKTIIALVAELIDLQERVLAGERIELPAVTLLFNSGQMLFGAVIRVTRAANSTSIESDATLLLQHQDKMTMSYVQIAAICGITVHYSDRNLHLLSELRQIQQ